MTPARGQSANQQFLWQCAGENYCYLGTWPDWRNRLAGTLHNSAQASTRSCLWDGITLCNRTSCKLGKQCCWKRSRCPCEQRFEHKPTGCPDSKEGHLHPSAVWVRVQPEGQGNDPSSLSCLQDGMCSTVTSLGLPSNSRMSAYGDQTQWPGAVAGIQGEAGELDHLSLKKRWWGEYLSAMSKYLSGGYREGWARIFLKVHSDRLRGSECEIEDFHYVLGKMFVQSWWWSTGIDHPLRCLGLNWRYPWAAWSD